MKVLRALIFGSDASHTKGEARRLSLLGPEKCAALMGSIYQRGDHIVGRVLLAHVGVALVLAGYFQTWWATVLTVVLTLGLWLACAWLRPGSLLTRVVSALALQSFVALHVYQTQGLPEIYFFFFTAQTVLIVYQDWRSIWPGALALAVYHALTVVNWRVESYSSEGYLWLARSLSHFVIAVGHVGLCGFWAHLLRRQTLAGAEQNLRLTKANALLRAEMLERETAEETQRELQAQFQRIAGNIPGMVFQYVMRSDHSFYFPFVSEGCRDLLGLEPRQVMSDPRTIFAVVEAGDLVQLRGTIRESAAGLTPWIWEGRATLADGRAKWIHGVARPEHGTDGAVRWDGVLTDATDRKLAEEKLRAEMEERRRVEAELREAQAHYQSVADNVPGMVFQFQRNVDGSYSFTYVSEGCQELFEMEPEAVTANVDSFFARAHRDDARSLFKSIEQSAETLTPWRWEGRFNSPSGAIKWVQGSSRPALQESGAILWDGIIVDVTELKTAEARMRAAKEEAERANRAKSEFLSRMSHELRTPLNAILGFSQILEMEPLEPEEMQSVRHVLKAGSHLLTLINEVLDVARIESGALEVSLEPIPLHELVEETINVVRLPAQKRGVTLRFAQRFAEPCFVLADLQRLKQVLLNLLSNAIKFNREKGTVTVSWELLAAAGDSAKVERIRLLVQDQGQGIRPEDLGRLFTPFDRLGAERGGIEGSGIGLALSKRLMEAMSGSIGVYAAEGGGSVFFVELPAAAAPVAIEPVRVLPEESSPVEARPRMILEIEDSVANRAVIEQVLEQRPHLRLVTALQGQLGLKMAREQRPDLILLDLHLPDLSGTEVLTRLRTDPQTAEIPVIALSADANPQRVERLLAMGANDYLVKPVEVSRLLEVTDRLLAEPAPV